MRVPQSPAAAVATFAAACIGAPLTMRVYGRGLPHRHDAHWSTSVQACPPDRAGNPATALRPTVDDAVDAAGPGGLLLDEVHDRHDRRRLLKFDSQLCHDGPEVLQELVE